VNPRPATVLVVDDTVDNLRVLGEILELDGHEVRVATSGQQALDTARQAPPDLILLDVMMPGLDGYATLSLLRADPATASVPVIFLTALDNEADEARGLELGASDFLSKPFKLGDVRRRIGQQLRLAQLQNELRECREALAQEREKIHGPR
jgi:putative two-component system response regulator